jgi:hypothetical protein
MSTSLGITFTASGSFSLIDEDGVTVFSHSPSFTTTQNNDADAEAIYTGEQLVATGSAGSDLALGTAGLTQNMNRAFVFAKNVDSDYGIEIWAETGSGKETADLNPGECFFAPMDLNADGSGTTLIAACNDSGSTAQKLQYLICDASTN